MTKPIRPDQVSDQKLNDIPPEVINTWNKLIAKNYNNGRSVICQEDIITALLSDGMVSRGKVFAAGWLDIEAIYEDAGWDVYYQGADYDSSGDSIFTFKKKKVTL